MSTKFLSHGTLNIFFPNSQSKERFVWTVLNGQTKRSYLWTHFSPQNLCSAFCVCLLSLPAPDPTCCPAGAGTGSSVVLLQGPELIHLHPRSTPWVSCNCCPSFFSCDPEPEAWVRTHWSNTCSHCPFLTGVRSAPAS